MEPLQKTFFVSLFGTERTTGCSHGVNIKERTMKKGRVELNEHG